MFVSVSDGPGKELGRTQNFDPRIVLFERNGVRHDQFRQHRILDVCIRLSRKNRVCAYSSDGLGAFINQCLCSLAQSASCINQIIDKDNVFAGHITDDSDACNFIGLLTILITDDQIALEVFGVRPGSLYTNYVRTCEGHI